MTTTFGKAQRKLTPTHFLVAGYAIVTLVIAALLALPAASSSGVFQSPVDAVFMASSGISTCGLAVVDVGKFYSLFGQIVLLIDFQIGGVGYMTLFVFTMYLLGGRLRLSHQLVAFESLVGPRLADVIHFLMRVTQATLIVEGIGAAILAWRWSADFPLGQAVYLGIFHSISAFCTAGISTFSDNLMPYQKDVVVNATISLLSLVGGIGFLVLADVSHLCKKVIRRERPRRLSVHSKLAIVVTAVVIVLGTGLIFLAEKWPSSLNTGDRLMTAAFQSISASTTDGFNSTDIGAMGAASLCMLMALMFIGASPGSTGGGIKTTTVGVLCVSLWAQLKRSDANVFQRRIDDETLKKAYAILLWSFLIVSCDTLVLSATENATFLQVLFESVSALGNAGLSTGITPSLSIGAKVLLSATMFVGRVGPLAIAMTLMARPKPTPYRYAQADLYVG
jgi:trk system potassium uptake protein TrkH